MKVNVQVGGRAKALNQSGRTAVSLVGLEPSLTEQVARDDAAHHLQHGCQPSARVLDAMLADLDGSYPRFISSQSVLSRSAPLALPWSAQQAARYAAMAEASVAEQQRIEAADSMLFEQYRQAYLSPERLDA